MPSIECEADNLILVIGACALDRLLHVPFYPKEDGKILCNDTFECGGGNAANTASGLGRISNSTALNQRTPQSKTSKSKEVIKCPPRIKVQLLTKIGKDAIQHQLCNELRRYSVDLSSKLFLHGPDGSSSPSATVVVSQSESHSRTCFFDTGTCGVLEKSDVENIDMDDLFLGALLLHSDSRHTDAAALMAREARKRGLPVSLDLERDRFLESYDELIEHATTIFASEVEQIKSFIERRRNMAKNNTFFRLADVEVEDKSLQQRFKYYIETASIFHSLMMITKNEGLELIITRGCVGALHCKVKKFNRSQSIVVNETFLETVCKMNIEPYEDEDTITLKHSIKYTVKEDGNVVLKCEEVDYEIHVVGPPILPENVIDSTGAGDAFIAGYLWSKVALDHSDIDELDFNKIMFQLRMGSWVAGKKLLGPGARVNLPSSEEVDNELGLDLISIAKSLKGKVGKISI